MFSVSAFPSVFLAASFSFSTLPCSIIELLFSRYLGLKLTASLLYLRPSKNSPALS